MKKEIGGFFELWVEKHKEYHNRALKVNSGRNAFAYILRKKAARKIYLPHYCCDALLEPLRAQNVKYEFYPISQSFEPIFDRILSPDEYLLYINYFGICNAMVKRAVDRFGSVIVDNSQAFFSSPLKNINTFYSPRKYFGVADGGYLYADEEIKESMSQDVSYQRYLYLLKRLDTTANETYPMFLEHEAGISTLPLLQMSRITRTILASIDYAYVKRKRNTNFRFLHKELKHLNELSLSMNDVSGPHVYPFLIGVDGLREYLISKKIYVATYWREVLTRTDLCSHENYLARHLVPLPVDQRYGSAAMLQICREIGKYLRKVR
jgi:hypothetical protein